MCTLFVSYAVFVYYFNCISFAIRLSGRKVAIKLIDVDWLTDWLIDMHAQNMRNFNSNQILHGDQTRCMQGRARPML